MENLKKNLINNFILLMIAAVCFVGSTTAQEVKQLVNVKVGEMVPDVTIDNILNYKTKTAKLSDFKGKLVILDFWGTWCGPCVAMIPRIDSLQRKFNDKIQFISVTNENEKTVLEFRERFKRNQYKQDISYPEVVSDSKLAALFPHNTVPHYVWIGKDGIVKSFTEFTSINSETISSYLNTGKLNVHQKVDELILPYEKQTTPLLNFLSNNSYGLNIPNTLTGYSIFARYINGLGYGGMALENEVGSIVKPDKPWRISFINSSAIWLYVYALGKGQAFINPNTRSIEVKDPKKFFDDSDEDQSRLIKEISFCLELVVPIESYSNRWQILKSEIDKYLPQYQANIETRIQECYTLIRTSNVDKIKAKNTEGPGEIIDDIDRYQLKNKSLSTLIFDLSWKFLGNKPYPVTDETGYTSPVDLDIIGNLGDIEALNKGLERYDLKIVLKKAAVKILVIRDREN